MRSTRAWVYALSIAALLVPAGGIAYLGAVSYRDERGAVDVLHDKQRAAADRIAARVDAAVTLALDGSRAKPGPLSRYWFEIDADGKLRSPAPLQPEPSAAADRGASCGGGALEACVKELATRQGRSQRLRDAQAAEAGGKLADARRGYLTLAKSADTGPAALVGLARLHEASALDELERRFGDRQLDGIPVKLVAAVMRGGDATALANAVLDGNYALTPLAQLGVVARLSTDPAIAERVAHFKREARAAAGLADDVPEIVRTAGPTWRGVPASRQPGRTLIYKKRSDGTIAGVAVDAPMLEDAAGHEASDDVAIGARALVLPAGTTPDGRLRTIAQVPLGAQLPHLALAVVNPLTSPDPLDAVIRDRARRHVMLTSALAIALGLGILATVRGAARARELAQLKSDFVSTVSHELKTPLTSIRMFAEMLEQGVAKGDAGKMARYHGVIVQESQRLGLLIANLLDYAQIERGTRRYSRTRQDWSELARAAVTTFETLRDPEKGSNPVEVEVSPEAMGVEVDTDRDVVVQAVLNLLANAQKYGGAAQPIEVAIGAAWISVRDHGPGIPASEQARIFREFYRAPEAYRSGVEGTGLGLALVKQHVEALGGTVEVASTEGEGATFTIKLVRA